MHGGIQRVIPNVINEMTKQHDITIIMPYSKNDSNIFGLDNNISLVNLNDFPKHNKYTIDGAVSLGVWKLNKRYGFLNNEFGSKILGKLMFSAKQQESLVSYINENKFDIVVALTDYYSLLLSVIAPYLNAKTIGWQHNTYDSYFLMKNRNSYGQENLFKKMMRNLDHLIVLTDADKEKYSKEFNVPTSTLYNPVSYAISQDSPKQENPLIFVGRLYQYQKGIDYLIDIIEEIKKYKPTIQIVLVGDGPDHQHIYDDVKNRGLQDNVRFAGMSSNVSSYYEKASVFLHTSRYEGFGVVLIEAMAFGIPVVAFHNNGPDEIITDGTDGFLIDKYDISNFAKKVIELLDDREEFNRVSCNAKKRVEAFLPRKVTEKFVKILYTVLNDDGEV